ncbi:hypothetical protein A3D83_00120 [Candidatus Daviesbacteria bacterium RIFCSPHIGHO2_02_FULL_41_10]|uniref:Lipoprotein YerB n=2 Tax=Candidatus Daviesiibacteriota TaxID=1752718 RepID=A0A1F5IRP3_9BACT|nr:MAG: hypothetical protein A2871_01700 [Candidatus Daviesbacteria bacterium RIFCSPHIGHO2_01_FULL_41_23]OGE33732.1 MAG: hypothetical protein A3D83_00120 [Candidatus Daviesbacteria bacterium RIFCSPHIGHO2_02_FULL_41_10]OGE62178.1 MAG: hypothetical protein A2967_00795 [Candidatus Daviesbacteria bacterium RIFCSPLOWO2_01_FULL_41_32]
MKKIISIFAGLTNIQRTLVLIILGVVLYGLSASLSYSLLSQSKPASSTKENLASLPGPGNEFTEDPNDPKTESCPLNGVKRTKKSRDFWERRRPLAVMVENHTESRPQSGLSAADVVYEAVAEGGITRFMAVYYCSLGDIQVGPVRSARTYYLDWLGEYDALYAHVGGANTPGPADALGQIIKYSVKDLNQFSIGFPVFWRDYQRLGRSVATEHTMYSTTAKLWAVGAKRGYTATDSAGVNWSDKFTPWKFKDDKGGGITSNITVNFWESQQGYEVNWTYDPAVNLYKRKNGGSPHMDLNNNTQLGAKVIVVQFEKESNANDGYPGNVHLLYGTTGTGKALFFQDGGVIEGKWIKAKRLTRTKYVDAAGKEIEFNRGQIWIQTVPEGSKVSY